ncbi:MAG: dockerin type I repeat-containing protein, partial [Paraprevotella sp.]|nr:dockerin type I repeat-containing protein [Paraprevotella sp.]
MKKLFLSLLLSAVAAFAFADNIQYTGDIDGDGEISLADMVKLASDILNNVTYNSTHDLNNDKKIDDADLQQLANIILNNIKSPQNGLDIGIGEWGDGGEFGGTVGVRRSITPSFTPFSISETKLDGGNNKYYFDINLSEQSNPLFCSAIINIKLPQNLNFSLDNDRNPMIVCDAADCIADHRIYGKPTLQKDGSLRFIVFSNGLTNFRRKVGSIARVYVTSRETEGTVTILPSELATRGINGVGSIVKNTGEMSFSLKDANVYRLTYMVDGEEYRTYEVKYGDKITPEPAPQKEG